MSDRNDVFVGLAILNILLLGAGYLGYETGAQACAQAGALSSIDQALGVIWRLIPLFTVIGLLLYIGGLCWLDYVRRSWAAHRGDERGPDPE